MLSIVVPAFNEESNIPTLLKSLDENLSSFCTEFEIIIIDDCSSDKTWEVLLESSNIYKKLRIIQNNKNLGIVKSWMRGLEESNFENVCLLDADLQSSPKDIERLWLAISENSYEVAQGIRVHASNIHISRTFFSKSLNWILNRVFCQNAKDSKSDFVIAPRETLLEFCQNFEKYRYGQTFIGVWLRRHCGRVIEIETEFRKRQSGNSFIKFYKLPAIISRAIFEILYFRLKFNKLPKFIEIEQQNTLKILPTNRGNFRKFLYFRSLPLHTWNIEKSLEKYYHTIHSLKFESLQALQAIQANRLRKLIAHSRLTTEHYGNIFQSGLSNKINQNNYLKILEDLPILEKSIVRNSSAKLQSNIYRTSDLYKINTSGSTGSPLSISVDNFQLTMRFATSLCAIENIGWRWGDSQIRLWHQTLGMTTVQKFREKLDAFLLGRRFVPVFKMTKNRIIAFVKLTERIKPTIVDGYAEALNVIANSVTFPLSHSPVAILSSAQELTEVTRLNVESLFGCPVLNKYGAREFSGIAYECVEGRRLHVAMESYIVEVLHNGRPVKPGQVGEVFITDLNNWSMPMIRYAIGDLAELGPEGVCECGRDTQTLGRIIGRTQALVFGVNGVILPGSFFSHLFKDFYREILTYQVVQSINYDIEILFIPSSEFNAVILDKIEAILKKTLGEKISLKFRKVGELELVKTGKRQTIISAINPNSGELSMRKIRVH